MFSLVCVVGCRERSNEPYYVRGACGVSAQPRYLRFSFSFFAHSLRSCRCALREATVSVADAIALAAGAPLTRQACDLAPLRVLFGFGGASPSSWRTTSRRLLSGALLAAFVESFSFIFKVCLVPGMSSVPVRQRQNIKRKRTVGDKHRGRSA